MLGMLGRDPHAARGENHSDQRRDHPPLSPESQVGLNVFLHDLCVHRRFRILMRRVVAILDWKASELFTVRWRRFTTGTL